MNTNPTQATETKPTLAPKSYGYFTFFPWVHESNPFGQAGEWG